MLGKSRGKKIERGRVPEIYPVSPRVGRDVILLLAHGENGRVEIPDAGKTNKHTQLFVPFQTDHGNCRFTPNVSPWWKNKMGNRLEYALYTSLLLGGWYLKSNIGNAVTVPAALPANTFCVCNISNVMHTKHWL